MPTYSIFGDRLHSEVTLPELRRVSTNGARWTLRVANIPPASDHADLLGIFEVMPGVNVRLYRLPGGYRLAYDDTGTFDISGDGREILWFQGPDPWVEGARLDIINRVLPLALHAAGFLCLHGSAVCVDQTAIAFLAPSAYGKSTLAVAMADIGARILTDDALAVELQSPVLARPGVHSVRLLDDSARALVGDADRLKAVKAAPLPRRDLRQLPPNEPFITKQMLRGLPAHKLMLKTVPLRAIYLLRPVRADGATVPVQRTALPAVRAALSLVEYAKSGVLLAKSEAAVLLDRAARVANNVPVYVLEVVRDLDRLPDVARRVAEWSR